MVSFRTRIDWYSGFKVTLTLTVLESHLDLHSGPTVTLKLDSQCQITGRFTLEVLRSCPNSYSGPESCVD